MEKVMHSNSKFKKQFHLFVGYVVTFLVLVGLYFTTFVNYLLFHTLAEVFSVVIAFSIFVVAWNSRRYLRNPYLVYIGVAYLFIAFIDLLHTLSYPGMPLFIGEKYFANQLWIGARYMESITLILAFNYLRLDMMPKVRLLFLAYLLATMVLLASVFVWQNFPVCFIEGVGQTDFKRISEYLISSLLVGVMLLLRINSKRFEHKIYRLLQAAILFTILSELAFTFYIDNYGFSNLVGHYFKLLSVMFVYVAIIKTGLEKPFELIFRDLDRVNDGLIKEIEIRKNTQKENEKLIGSLKQALEEIKTLQGMLPICSICKRIRDDQGYWDGIESYLSKKSELVFSHCVCPSCAQEHYPAFYPKIPENGSR